MSKKVVFVEITGDTHETVEGETREMDGFLYVIKSKKQGPQKSAIVKRVAKQLGGLNHVVMVGNGKNDVESLRAVKQAGGVSICIIGTDEGFTQEAANASTVCMLSPVDAYIDLNENQIGLYATGLRE